MDFGSVKILLSKLVSFLLTSVMVLKVLLQILDFIIKLLQSPEDPGVPPAG